MWECKKTNIIVVSHDDSFTDELNDNAITKWFYIVRGDLQHLQTSLTIIQTDLRDAEKILHIAIR